MYVFVFEDHMLDWHSCQMCYPLEIKLLLLLLEKTPDHLQAELGLSHMWPELGYK